MSYMLHLLNTALLYRLCRKLRLDTITGFLITTLFGCFPLVSPALSHAVIINDVLALTFTLLMLHLVTRPSAPLFYGLSLLSKESLLFIPLIIPLHVRLTLTRLSRPVAITITALMLLTMVVFLLLRSHGLAPGGTPYAMRLDHRVLHNFMTYIYWSTALRQAIPDLVRSFNPQAWHWSLPVLLVLLGIAFLKPAGRSLIVYGLLLFTLALLPVLPLIHSTYNHYLYGPILGWCIAEGTALASLVGQSRLSMNQITRPIRNYPSQSTAQRGFGVFCLAGLALLYAWRSDILISERWNSIVQNSRLPLDPSLRSVEVARRSIGSIVSSLNSRSDSILILTPPESVRYFGARSGQEYGRPRRAPAGYDLLRTVLDDGRAVKLFFPQVDTVAFLSQWRSQMYSYVVYIPADGGWLIPFGHGPIAHLAIIQYMIDNGWYASARMHLEQAHLAFPNDTTLAAAYGRLFQHGR
jgi:hypothetical protein